jgi:ethanolamine utilization cobalamin adenosyltransferase
MIVPPERFSFRIIYLENYRKVAVENRGGKSMEKQKAAGQKQEHTTFLSVGVLVDKSHARVEFRGRLDSLSAAVVALQILGQREGRISLVEELEEVRGKVYDILSCEVTGKPCEDLALWGLSSEEIRERSHHPGKYLGLDHIRPHHTMGVVAAGLNELRTKIREAELSACRAFQTPQGPERPDIVMVLNRLSSALYVLTYKYLPKGYDKTVRFAKSNSNAS